MRRRPSTPVRAPGRRASLIPSFTHSLIHSLSKHVPATSHVQACAGVEHTTVKAALSSRRVSGHRGLSLLSGVPSDRDSVPGCWSQEQGAGVGGRRPWLFSSLDGEERCGCETPGPPDKRELASGRAPHPCPQLARAGDLCPWSAMRSLIRLSRSVLTSPEHRGEGRGLGPQRSSCFSRGHTTSPDREQDWRQLGQAMGAGELKVRAGFLWEAGWSGRNLWVGVQGRLGCPPPVPHLGLKTILRFQDRYPSQGSTQLDSPPGNTWKKLKMGCLCLTAQLLTESLRGKQV